MSQTATERVPAVVIEDPVEIKKYPEISRLFDALIETLTPGHKVDVVAKYLAQTSDDEYQMLLAKPVWSKMLLATRGDAIVIRLLKNNWEHVGTTAMVRMLFGIPSSTLHREKDQGGVIAYRRGIKGEYFYPLEQFAKDTIYEWAKELVNAVGNGAPALQFLYAERASLEGKSFADAFRENPAGTVEPFRKSIRRLIAE
jgi:hypothetical protein